jgi:biopolymer transport protein ExbB/TolQ
MNRSVKILLILGVIFTFVPPSIGLLFTVISMNLAFHDLSQSQQGIADPHQLAGHIGDTLIFTASGLVFSAVGIVMLIIAVLRIVFAKPAQKSIGTA